MAHTNDKPAETTNTRSLQDAIAWAKAYPFKQPERSFIMDGEGLHPLPQGPLPEGLLQGREAVIASGSNASPERLQQKFRPHEEAVIVTGAWICDYAIAHSAHISSYASIPATLHHLPGVRSRVYINWLTPSQLKAMHATEALGSHYGYYRLENLTLECDHDSGLRSAHVYWSLPGTLHADGRPILAADWDQETLLNLARQLLLPEVEDMSVDDFIALLLGNAERRRELSVALGDHGIFSPPPCGERLR